MITALDLNTALVLIDFQKRNVRLPVVHPIADVLARAAQLVAAFRAAELPIVIVNVNPAGAAWTKTRKEPQPALPSPPDGLEITPEIQTSPADIFITKSTWNAFFDTSLHQQLQARHVTGIVLGGIATGIGVDGTARAASELGYNLTFATDAMTDVSQTAHDNSLRHIFPRLGEVGTTADVVALLAARHE